jgi:hypothetical protein
MVEREIGIGRSWRDSTSAWPVQCALSALCALCALLLALPARGFTPPDPVTFGVRIEAGDVPQAREWLDAGLDPNYVADRIGTGLMIAAWNGDLVMIRLFLDHGADVNRSNALDEQALMHAAWRGQLAAIDLLIERGARVNNPPMHWSALHYAVFADRGEAAARLLERGADLNARSTNGSSVLMMAVYEGHETLAKQLIARGADLSIRNDHGDGALEWAFKFGRLGIARLVADRAQFAAAANRPKESWGPAVKSLRAEAAPAAPAAEAKTSEAAAQLAELTRIRAVLAERGMNDSVKRLDLRIAALRENMRPAPRAAAAANPQTSQLDELLEIRALLAARKLDDSVKVLDRRIAALRAQRARPELATPTAVRLEISARRAAPEDQTTRMIFESTPQLP